MQLNACTEAGGVCKRIRDGFYPTSVLLITIGTLLLLYLRPALQDLEGLPLENWRVKQPRRLV
jgi:hypothetical protein